MKTCVCYYSLSGNTKKVADRVAKGLGVKAENINELDPKKLECDFLVVGGPVHRDRAAGTLMKFLRKLKHKPEKCAVFCTHVSASPGRSLDMMKKTIGAACVGEFDCIGSLFILRIKRPFEKDLKRAEEWGKKLRAKTKKAKKKK